MLKKAELQIQHLEQFKKNTKDKEYHDKLYSKLIVKAEGGKVKDNPKLIKKNDKTCST